MNQVWMSREAQALLTQAVELVGIDHKYTLATAVDELLEQYRRVDGLIKLPKFLRDGQ